MPSTVVSLPYNLEGRVAIVTGANHGIGAATARALAACGASVLVTYLRVNDPESYAEPARSNRARDANHVVDAIHEIGGTAMALEADLSESEAPIRLFDSAEAQLGPVDILVNNASGWLSDTFAMDDSHVSGAERVSLSASSHDAVFSVDARGSALMIAEFSKRHIGRDANWGRIIGLTSGGPLGFPGEVSYGAAKAALENYTMAAALELAPYGITANVVHPPVTDTGWVNDEVRNMVKTSRELIHVAEPEDVAAVIAHLCSDEAWLITANVIHLR
jgi:3-oxoacyl-[acyl-carrier protein] reductase